jgi:hypothetical protein
MAVQTKAPPIIITVNNEDQSLLLRDTGISNGDFIDNDGFVSGLPRFKDLLGPAGNSLVLTSPEPGEVGGPGEPGTSLAIQIESPVSNQIFGFPAAQQGGTITAKGIVKSVGYSIQSLAVKFGDSAFSPASYTVDESDDSIHWKCVSDKITTSGELELKIIARVTGHLAVGPSLTREDTRTLKIKLTDDTPPTVTIDKPAVDGFEVTSVNSVFTVTIEGTAKDNASGIRRVEYSLGGPNWNKIIEIPSEVPAPLTLNWKKIVELPFQLTPYTISVRAIDGAENKPTGLLQRTVITLDTTEPELIITEPENGVIDLPIADGASEVILPRMEGTAKDVQSGVESVEWALGENPNENEYNSATLQYINNGKKWSVQNIRITGPAGLKNIRVRCVSGAGIITVKNLNVAVSKLYPPKKPTVQEYFSSLLDFIVRRVVKKTNANPKTPLEVKDLTGAFYQPFQDLLSADEALQNQQAHQLRICIEVLRKHFDKTVVLAPSSAVAQAQAILQTAESKYRQRAYETLLSRIGTSYEEIRAARLLDTPARRALAQRLGFDLPLRSADPSGHKDALEQFLLQPGQFTEADLETLFGLVDTTRDPLEKRDSNPTLLDLQLQYLEGGWAKQDDDDARPIIDPDVIGAADLYSGVNPAYDFWQKRQAWVKSQLAAFQQQLKQSQPKSATVFDELVGSVLGPIRDLQALETQLGSGADIEPRLAEKQLSLPAFVRLMKLRQLTTVGALLDSEVDDVASILAQAQKLRSFADWRQEEQGAGLVLGLDFFRFPAADEPIVPPDVSPEWRASAGDRRIWQDTLQARIDQQKSLKQALLSVIDAAEEESLPLLRDGLVKAMDKLSSLFEPAENQDQSLSQISITPETVLEDQLLPVEDNEDGSISSLPPPPPPPPGPGATALTIKINSPAKNQSFSGSIFRGVKIKLRGSVVAKGYTVQSLDVQFGDSAFLPLFAPGEGVSGSFDWECASSQITTRGPLTIIARVTGKTSGGSLKTVTTTRTVVVNLSDDSDTLTQQLLIDIKTGGYQKITRIEQAIQTLQSLLIDLRMGSLDIPWERDTSKESEEEFDEELHWMGAYANWYSAMQVFLHPENFLLPTLRPTPDLPEGENTPSEMEKETQTHAFRELIKDLRNNPQLTPEQARSFAKDYFDMLKSDYKNKFQLPALLNLPILPSKPFQITEQYTQSELLKLSQRTKALIDGVTLINPTTGTTNPPAVQLQNIPAYLREIFYFVPIALALNLQRSGQYLAALDWFQVVYAYDLPVDERKIYYGLTLENDFSPDPKLLYRRNVFWLKEPLNPHEIVNNSFIDPGNPANPSGARHDAYTRFVVISLVRCLLDFADAEFTQDTNESLPRARSLYMQALELLDIPEMIPPDIPGLSANSVVTSMKLRAQANLAKLRSGRNIIGLKRQLEPASPEGQATGILPLIVANSPFGTSSTKALQPTPYRYSILIDRAKQLVTIAQQVEATFLATLEKRDVEEYNLLKANLDLGLAQANVQLQNLRVTEAADGVTLAQKQQERAAFQVQSFQNLLNTGMNVWERQLLNDYRDAREARNWKIKLDAAVNIAELITKSASGGFLGTGIGPGLATTAGAAAQILAQSAQAIEMSNLEARTQEHSLRASFEQRKQEWTQQLGLGQTDVAISNQQIQLAKDHQNIVDYELFIAQIQTANAQAMVEFLSHKFTNVELYEWMSGVLQEVYSSFLQQATAVARLAQNQLAFERQEATPLFIKNDYWQPPADDSAFGSSSERDRRGLTGSARLLQDIYQLDQFAFETNKRKLQLAKTISLSQLAPLEFQRFRESGVLTFATPRQLFDRDFPGHYLRLIRQVRASVVALIPPNQGIRATLTASGLSRVVTGGDVFQPMTVRRDMESVALTSPAGATGLFELAPQSDLMMPFEFMGVDTIWNLEMPKAANPFDYRTIADVLLTIEYTALSSLDYRRQVIQQLDRTVSADRAFSFRNQFPDQWYDLHNPEQTSTPMTASFSTTREDFPSNVEDFTTGQVALYFVLADGKTTKDLRAQLHFTEQEAQTAVGGEATATPDGIISTRLGNAPSWTPMISRSPFGRWELALPDTAEVRSLFASDAISDIVFVLTTSGRTPAWPL